MPVAAIYGKDKEKLKEIIKELKILGFDCVILLSSDKVIQALEGNDIVILVIENSDDTDNIIKLIQKLPMYKRRNMFIVMVGEDIPTMDRFFAFKEGVNLTVNYADIENFPLYFKESYLEYKNFYKQFKERESHYKI